MSFAQPVSGDLVGGRYRIVRELGRGAMGVVYEAVHEGLGRKCALKLLRPAQSSDQDAVRRFEREARILAKLASPHLVEVLDVARTDEGVPFLVMELLEGESLEARIARGPLVREEALAVLRDVSLGVHAAHVAGVVHRDLKLSNVMLTATGAKVVDFGVASFFDGSMDGSTASVAGTPRTMSPEQLLGEKVGPASDVWAIGVVAYRLFAGKYPFEAESMASQMLAIMKGYVPLDRACAEGSEVDAHVARAIDAALVSDPTLRMSSALDFARALETPRPAEIPKSSAASSDAKEAAVDSPEVSSPTRESVAPLPVRSARLGARSRTFFVAIGALALLVGGLRLWSVANRPGPESSGLHAREVAPGPSLPATHVVSAPIDPPTMPSVLVFAPHASSASSPVPRPVVPAIETVKSAHGPPSVPSGRAGPKPSSEPIGDGLPIHL